MTREELIRIQLQNRLRVMEVNQRVEISSEIDPKFVTMIDKELYKHRNCQYLLTISSVQSERRLSYRNEFRDDKNYKLVEVKPISKTTHLNLTIGFYKDNIIEFDQTMFRDINIDSVLGCG